MKLILIFICITQAFISVFYLVKRLFKSIAESYNDSLITNKGWRALHEPERKKYLRMSIDEYHKTGVWNNNYLLIAFED